MEITIAYLSEYIRRLEKSQTRTKAIQSQTKNDRSKR